ncbi:MAG: DNA cytosine methyltransferase [Desulfovibrionaceae bacterium]
MRFGSLFAGIGGFDLGLKWAGMECAWQVEIDPFCVRVLEKHWPEVPRYGDIKNIDPADLAPVDLLCGGYPCQPFSNAGKRKGADDDRHLWPEIVRLLRVWRGMGRQPSWCLFENVAGHVSMGLDDVLFNLGREGYAAWPLIIPACAVGARHRRNRVWIVAHSERDRIQGWTPCAEGGGTEPAQEQLAGLLFPCPWPPLSVAKAHGVGDGVPYCVGENKALGNAVVPQVAWMIGTAIKAAHEGRYVEM